MCRTHLFGIGAIVIVATLISACKTDAPTKPPTDNGPKGVIRGVIVGGLNKPISGVTITTDPATHTVTTDANGGFAIDSITPGVYLVQGTKSGASTAGNFTVLANDTARANMRLSIWKLAWSDEFDGTAIDTFAWFVHDGPSGVLDHLEYLSSQNVSVESGLLRLRSQEQVLNGFAYTSAQVSSHRRDKYGRFEIRARLPRGKGIWPAHWLWRFPDPMVYKEFDPYQEIDIMEMLGQAPTTIYQTYHFFNDKDSMEHRSHIDIGPDYSKDFHVFAVEWYPDEIKWFIDGVEKFRMATVGKQDSLHVLLDTYIGGSWPGPPDSTTAFPQYHDVDYVRIYQAEE